MTRVLEICIDTPEGLHAATEGRADRVELCSALDLGGLTPSAGLMRLAAQAPLPAFAMIRPRAGGFNWSVEEITAMEVEVLAAREAGLAGVVIGATRSGRLDLAVLARLIRAAEGMQVTLHRCIDLLEDPLTAVEEAAELGIHRILSSGGALHAVEGLARLKAMKEVAAGRLSIMPGAGVNAATLPQILAALDPAEVHASASSPAHLQEPLTRFGFQSDTARQTDPARVAELKALLG
ncbi:copper homeostasis protein [Pseudooceanicola antarcticus]|uniref:PF03932 family protein CutC n=1 Tax=Pseudooceanicola antarcticus TaxID=1247613 RepID=A0A285IJH3_9RHOB|nr:copper homeostasis protein CutC [Pseudooceanicola antarcticus]PJE28819.1 copper homeostasis protein CutC [Pseudooceanicola antarcticus]SNY48139.1 copper homeostasis protein [Pseudooceanicola antarcticus]